MTDFREDVRVLSSRGSLQIHLHNKHGLAEFLDSKGEPQVWIIGDKGQISVGAGAGILLNGGSGTIWLGRDGLAGNLVVRRSDGEMTIRLDGQRGDARLGGGGADGDVHVLSRLGKETIHLSGAEGKASLGVDGQHGEVVVCNSQGEVTIQLEGHNARAVFGGDTGAAGDVTLKNRKGLDTVHFDGQQGEATFGGNGADGGVVVRNAAGAETIRLDGDTGDIQLTNADCAEEWDTAPSSILEPGDVAIFNDAAALERTCRAYDRRVAGIVAGAAHLRPGIVLGRDRTRSDRAPLALMGRVFCRVDAGENPVGVGDLLTTSERPGHAMKAVDSSRAFGAVLGKSLGRLETGTGLVEVLVGLQ